MVEIIKQSTLDCNTSFSRSSDISYPTCPADSILRIPKLAYRILCDLKEHKDLEIEFVRGLKELSKRYKRSSPRISHMFGHLEKIGFIKSYQHGQAISIRWITCEGYIWLGKKQLNQTLNQDDHIPYLYLPETRDIENCKIIKEEEVVENEENISVEEKLNKFFEREKISFKDRMTIKNQINRSMISKAKLFLVLNRITAVSKNNRIQAKLAYILTAIRNEDESTQRLKEMFIKKGLKINYYNDPNVAMLK